MSVKETALERALALQKVGFWIFPSAAKNQHPAGWPAMATNSEATIRQWFSPGGPYAHCWPSIYTGKFGDGSQSLLAVDVDPRGMPAMDILDDVLPDTRVHRTPRKGLHGFYAVPFPGVKSGTNVLADGVDIRSKGGLVFFGEGYTLEQDAPIAKAPFDLVQRCGMAPDSERKNKGEPVADAAPDALERAREWLALQPAAIEGEGGDAHTFKVACGLRDLGVSQAQAVELLSGEWNERCAPPWTLAELETKAANSFRYAENAPGERGVTDDDLPMPRDVEQTATAAIERAAKRAKGGTLQDMAQRINTGAYLVKGLLRRKAHAVMYGAPGEGKSYVALDLSYHVAAGRDWMRRRVNGGPVLYLAFEGLGGMPERAAALLRHYGAAAVPLVIEPADWNLREKAGREALGARMAEIRAEHFGGREPALIVIDTLARSMRGGDENSAADVGALNDAVTALIGATGAAVLLIHHSGKDASKGARGSSALLGAVDTEIEVDGGRLRSTKQRDMELGQALGFKLQPVAVGEDGDGDPLQACVVLPDAAGSRPPAWKPSGKAAIAWAALCDLSGPENALVDRGALLAAFRARAYPTGTAAESTSRSALDRALGALLERGMIEGPEGGPWRRALRGG